MDVAAVLFCTEKVGWNSGWTWEIELPSWPMVLAIAGYASFGFVCVLPLINTFVRPWMMMNSVAGGTRGEPFVASLASYICPFLLTCIEKHWDRKKLKKDESAWINGVGACFYVVYLCLFLCTADAADRRTTVRRSVPAGAAYIGLTAVAGLLFKSTVTVNWLCTLARVVSACISLVLAFYVVEKVVENLPDRVSSSVTLLYYMVWGLRALYPKRDNHALAQTLVGAVCSVVFIFLLSNWPRKAQTASAPEQEPFLPKLPPPHPPKPDPPLQHKPEPQPPLQQPPLQQAINLAEHMDPEAADPAGPINPLQQKMASAPPTPEGRPRPAIQMGKRRSSY